MSRTGVQNTSRTSKTGQKSAGRKPAAKPAAPPKRKPATEQKTGRTKSASVPAKRHEIRTRVAEKPATRRAAPTTARHPEPETTRKRRNVSPAIADDKLTMKKTSGSKTRIAPEEKEPRTPVPEPAKAKAAAPPPEIPPKETPARNGKSRAPRASKTATPEPADIAPEAAPTRRRKTDDEEKPAARGKGVRGSRTKSAFGFDDELMQDYVMDDESSKDELDEELAMDPMELPLELLDPELVEVPRPVAVPKPKPKPVTSKRMQACANCGNTFIWLSVDQLCFNCLKKKLAQKKREDETYPGFTGEAEEEEDAS